MGVGGDVGEADTRSGGQRGNTNEGFKRDVRPVLFSASSADDAVRGWHGNASGITAARCDLEPS